MWSPWLKRANEVLADLFPTIDQSRMIAIRAGMRTHMVPANEASLVNWNGILRQAVLQSPDPRAARPALALALVRVALELLPDNEQLLALLED